MTADLFPGDMQSGAILSDCGRYRYLLTRTWDATLHPLCWVMLNPSTADASVDDPTIRRCVAFSRGFGFGGLKVVNLYALRSTDPKALWRAGDPVGPENDRHILDETAGEFVVAAWGANAKPARVKVVMDLIGSWALSIDCLGVTNGGQPKHPLFLAGTTKLAPFKHWEAGK